ncbi:hypothetical protein PCAR4_200125 [Paraburkholderia caribensis]|nr:hypothetical protein PCAR4_200125 [Paraburkholderia caribensis]
MEPDAQPALPFPHCFYAEWVSKIFIGKKFSPVGRPLYRPCFAPVSRPEDLTTGRVTTVDTSESAVISCVYSMRDLLR